MITTRIIPESTATSQEFMVEITEPLCKPYYVVGGTPPTVTVAFSNGTVKLVNGNAVVPITATITIATPSVGCGCARTQVYVETFNVAFTATTTNAITLTPGDDVDVSPMYIKCCRVRSIKATTTLTVGIA